MRAKELVPILAEIYGVPFETAFMIDRSLSEAGLRAKGRGRNLPEMTRREAIIFLVACMVTAKATKAGQEVQPWLSAYGWIADESDRRDDPLEMTEYEAETQEPEMRNYYMRKVVKRLDYQVKDGEGLIDCLLAVCNILEKSPHIAEAFKFEISVSHGWAVVSVNEPASGGYSEIRFQTEAGSEDPIAYETQINKSAVVYGDALLALAVRTADPLADEGGHDG